MERAPMGMDETRIDVEKPFTGADERFLGA